MDAMVTARMPQGKKEAGNLILAELGTNPSQFINDVYDYVIKTKHLPFPEKSLSLGGKDTCAAIAFVDSIPLQDAHGFEGMTDDGIRQERLIARGLATENDFQ